MSATALEAFLARLYVDAAARASFLADPLAAARAAGLDEQEAAAVAAVDRGALQAAAHSFAHKRAGLARPAPRSPRPWWRRLLRRG